MSSVAFVLSLSLLTGSAPVAPSLLAVGSSAHTSAQGGPASAESGAPPQAAIDAFMRGKEFYAAARYDEALAAFQEADRLHPAPDLQFNIGLCYMRLESWDKAINAFEIYLRTKENAADRADVEARIDEAKRRLEEQSNQPDPTAATTGDPGAGDPAQTSAGSTVDGDRDPPPETKGYRGLIVAGSVLLGLGAAGAIGGASGLGFAIRQKNDEIDEIVDQGNPREVQYADAVNIQEDAERLRTLQLVAVGVGAGVAVVGGVLLGLGLKRRKDARARAASAVLRPWGSPEGGGFTLQGAF